MNIFNIYLDKIKKIILDQYKNGLLKVPENINSINVDIPPEQFDCDISTNVAMVLSKINQKSPIDLANQLTELIKKDDININSISVAKPGFINIKFNNNFWNEFLKNIINSKLIYGSNSKQKKQKYLVEFVSANPTGPLHVGHSRGAVLGDIISNILKFNNHDVVKEYYVNDYGNQIINFTKSVYLRIREILNKETFPKDNPELYPGDYIIQIANNIINENKKFDFIIKSPPASHYIKEAARLKGGSKEPGRQIVASITKEQAKEIAKKKMEDLNANDLDQAVKIISGSARSMGIEVKD